MSAASLVRLSVLMLVVVCLSGCVPPQRRAAAHYPPDIRRVTGVGVAPPSAQHPGQARAMAVRAARLDAERQLLELAKGVTLQSGTTVQNMMLQDDRIRSRVEGIIRGARVVDTRYSPDGMAEVDMEFDMSSLRYNVR